MLRCSRGFPSLLICLLCLLQVLAGSGVSFALIEKAEERKIGRQVVAQVRSQFRVVDDLYVSEYLETIGRRVGKSMDAKEFDMDFHVVADSRINACAVPGGHIFMTSESILIAADGSEVAGVIAHEMGHVEGRHIAHRMESAAKVNVATIAAVLAAVFLGGSPEAGIALSTFAIAGAQTKMLQYSRDDEEDADRRAVRALEPAGYDGWGLVRFMETIRRSSPVPDGVPAYLFTHPLPENRTAYLSTALEGTVRQPPTPAELGSLWRIQARVLVQDPRPWGRERMQALVDRYPDSPDARLGLALLLRQEGRYGASQAQLETANRLAPADREILHETASTVLLQGRPEEALQALEELRRSGRATAPALRDLGWVYLESDRGADALAVYDELANLRPHWDQLAYYRGLALGKAGREGEGFASLGDYYRDQDRPDLAKRQYQEAAKRLPDGELKTRVEEELGKKQRR